MNIENSLKEKYMYIYGTKDLGAFLGFWYPNAAAPLPLPFPFDSGTAGITLPSPPTLAGAAAFETGAAFGSGAARETPELNPAWLMKRCAPCRRDWDNPPHHDSIKKNFQWPYQTPVWMDDVEIRTHIFSQLLDYYVAM